MDWHDAQMRQAVIVVFWSLVIPLVIWVARKRWPAFDVSPARRKWLAAISTVALATFVSTPGDWGERAVAALLAVVLSQGVYLNTRNLFDRPAAGDTRR